MKLRCKTGDWAMFVGARTPTHSDDMPHVGQVVRVGQPTTHPWTGEPGWHVSPPLGGKDRCLDAALVPLQNPGEDARDQTLDWLPVPQLDPVAELRLAVQRLEAVNRRLRAIP